MPNLESSSLAGSAPSEQEVDRLDELLAFEVSLWAGLAMTDPDQSCRYHAHRNAELIDWLRTALPGLLATARDGAHVEFLSKHCAAVTLRDSDGVERELPRDYFSVDDDFREFMRQLPAEYEEIQAKLAAANPTRGTDAPTRR